MKKVTIIIPKRYNNGLLIADEIIGKCLYAIRKVSGGYTISHVRGCYTMDNGDLCEEENYLLFCVVDDSVVCYLADVARNIANWTDQESIYFEVVDCNASFVHKNP